MAAATKPKRHVWSDRYVLDEHRTKRVCWNCCLIKLTRHEPPQHWVEWYAADGQRIQSQVTPPCTSTQHQSS